jgi:hypothetical protein
MKPKLVLTALVGSAILLQGCIAFPPLVQIERKDAQPTKSNNDEVIKRLDAIDKRLSKLEEK